MIAERSLAQELYGTNSPAWFLRRFGIVVILALVTGAFSPEVQKYLVFSMPVFIGSDWLSALSGLAILFIGGGRIIARGVRAAISLKPTADSQFALVLLVSAGYSSVQTVANAFVKLADDRDYWWQLAVLVVLLLFVRWFELSAVLSALDPSNAASSSAAHIESSKRLRLMAKVIPWFFYGSIVLALATVAVLAPLTLANSSASTMITSGFVFERALTVLAIVSLLPFALSVELPKLSSLQAISDLGLSLFSESKFELLRKTDVVVFGKSGTITTGKRRVFAVRLAHGNPLTDTNELLALAGGIELGSDHPIATAILKEVKKRKLEVVDVRDKMVMPGQGISARIEGFRFFIGGPSLLNQNSISIDVSDLISADEANTAGRTVVYVVRDDVLLGTIELTEDSRESAKAAVLELRYQRRRVVLLTSEAVGVAKSLAAELGIEEYFAEVLPHQKASVIQRLQKDGSIVTVVADPEDEVLALKQADIAVAFDLNGATSDIETETPLVVDLALAGTDLVVVSKLLRLSSTDSRIQLGNMLVAMLYNLAVLGLCATSLVGSGFVISPVIALLLMSLATVTVAVNTQRLRRR